jgi:hypothetical protein
MRPAYPKSGAGLSSGDAKGDGVDVRCSPNSRRVPAHGGLTRSGMCGIGRSRHLLRNPADGTTAVHSSSQDWATVLTPGVDELSASTAPETDKRAPGGRVCCNRAQGQYCDSATPERSDRRCGPGRTARRALIAGNGRSIIRSLPPQARIASRRPSSTTHTNVPERPGSGVPALPKVPWGISNPMPGAVSPQSPAFGEATANTCPDGQVGRFAVVYLRNRVRAEQLDTNYE